MTSISTSGQFFRIQTQNLAIQARMTEYSEQTSTGKKGTVYGALGSDVRQSIDLRGHVNELDTYQKNIATAQLRVTSAIDTMDRIKDVARDVRDQLTKLSGNPPPDQTVVKDIAQRGYNEVAQLLNTKVEGRYIFAGSDIGNQPFPNAGQFFTDIQTQVNNYAANGALATVTATTAIATEANGITYFSTALQTADPSPLSARVDRNLDLSYQVRANGPEFPPPPAPPPPAGQIEPFREILRSLATAANLTYDPAIPASFNDFQSLLTTTRTSLDTAAKNVDNHVGILGSTAARMKALDTQHDETMVTLKQGIGDVEDVDMAETISKLQLVQTQLQASYKVTATLQKVNLIDFI
jgi:flagellar hook-associated protein 3 FlgL